MHTVLSLSSMSLCASCVVLLVEHDVCFPLHPFCHYVSWGFLCSDMMLRKPIIVLLRLTQNKEHAIAAGIPRHHIICLDEVGIIVAIFF
jgi:hypothetical protein